MNPQTNLQDSKELKRLLARQQVITCGTVVALILLAFSLMRHQPQVILEPPTRTKTMTVQGDTVDSQYMIEIGQYVAHMMLDATPKVIDARQEEVLKWVHPKTFGTLQNRMAVAAKRLKESNSTTIFWPQQVAPDPDNLRIALIGTLETYVNGTRQPPDKTQAWLLELDSTGGRMTIKDWKETPLDDPLLAKATPTEATPTGAKNAQH